MSSIEQQVLTPQKLTFTDSVWHWADIFFRPQLGAQARVTDYAEAFKGDKGKSRQVCFSGLSISDNGSWLSHPY